MGVITDERTDSDACVFRVSVFGEFSMNTKDTKELQAVAIILMMWHHLFGTGTFLILESSTWSALNKNAIILLGQSGKICIAVYLICSGYGLYKSFINCDIVPQKSNFRRVLSFLIRYWLVVFVVAIPYLIFTGKFQPQYLFVNLFALLHNDQMLYVSFSWYVKLYLLILLFVPIMRRFDRKSCLKTAIGEVIGYVILPMIFYFTFRDYNRESEFVGLLEFLISSVLIFLEYLTIFY